MVKYKDLVLKESDLVALILCNWSENSKLLHSAGRHSKVKNVFLILKEKIKFPGGKEFLRRVLKKISFKFRKCKNELSVMEGNGIMAWRATNLTGMKKNNEVGSNKKLKYLDKMWIT
jgi:hypothetical protein